MTEHLEPRPLTARIDVAASPAAVWSIVSDVRRTGEWSPECRRVLPLGRVRAGTLFVGLNRRARVRWATLSRVIAYAPEQEIGWRVLTNRAEWRYELRPEGAGTSVVQTRRTPRGEGRFALWFTRAFLGGLADHDTELEQGMADGLEKIKALAEAVAVPTGSRGAADGGTVS